jgi:stage II sporulation protein D
MYVGVGGEYASTEAAVDATRGEVVTYAGKPVVTYFFSTSGGRTEAVENSFVGSEPKPWLKSVSDPYDSESPRHRWSVPAMSMSTAASKLNGYVKGSFRGIDVIRRGESPRVVYADVVGSDGRTRVTGAVLRARFGLYDSWATFNVITASGRVDNPKSADSAPEPDEASGGISPGTARTASAGRTLRGRVGWVERRTRVRVQRRTRAGWTTLFEVVTDRRGRFSVGDLDRGTYRVRWRGSAGPDVSL